MSLIELDHMNRSNMRRVGICFEAEQDVQLLADVLQEELEVRIGSKIAKNKTPDALTEFDECHRLDQCKAWLDKYCPDCKKIIECTKLDLELELLVFRSHIPGATTQGRDISTMLIKKLKLDLNSLNAIEKSSDVIDTIGDLVRIGDYTDLGLDEESSNRLRNRIKAFVEKTIVDEQKGWD